MLYFLFLILFFFARGLWLKDKLSLPRIVHKHSYQERDDALRYHVVDIDVFAVVDGFREKDGTSGVQHPTDAPDDKISPSYALLLAM